MVHFNKIGCILVIVVFASCRKTNTRLTHSDYKPVLIATDKIQSEVKILPSKENKLITLMRKTGNYVFALDYGLGIHIIDVSNTNSPSKKGFYQIPACIDFEVRGNIVYANNYRDFITIDFTDINNPLIIKREAGAFDIAIKTPDGLSILDELKQIPLNTTIISYEKI